jgi:integrase
MRLTATTIRTLTLPPAKSDYTFFDSDLPGFGLRLRATGGKTWVVQYAIAGRTRRMVLGSTAVLDPGKARETAKDLLAQVRLGRDPASEKGQALIRAGDTFGVLVKSHLIRQQKKLRPSTLHQAKYVLGTLCRELHNVPITALDRRTIAARLSAISERNGPAMANSARVSLSAFCTWAAMEGYIENNPVTHTPKAIGNPARERLLSDDELMAIWHASSDIARSSSGQAGRGSRRGIRSEVFEFDVILQLLILTGLRKSEISDLSWSEVDLKANLITLPANRVKNGKVHLVPMSEPVRALIEAQPRRPGRDLLFGGVSVRGFTAWSRLKRKLDAQITEMRGAPLPPWVIHDARRAFSTTMHDRLGVPPHIVETLLGHTGHQSGVAGVYNRSTYLNECARALNRWADHVMALVSDKPVEATVVPLRAM